MDELAQRAPARSRVPALIRACHPVPAAAVTVFATVLAATAGNAAGTCTVLALALAAGQLSIGWSNDRIDAARDRAVGRSDKPVAQDPGLARLVDRAVLVALLATVGLSAALGWRAGLLHLAAVGCGWAYNLGLKSTWLSWLPYCAAFGALPGIATLALPSHPSPAWWAVAGGALLGGAAHLANTVPDLAGDALTGVRGLPHRLGGRVSLVVAAAALFAGTVVLVLGPPGTPSPVRWAGLGVATAWTGAGALLAARRPTGRWAFAGVLATVALDIALLVLGPSLRR